MPHVIRADEHGAYLRFNGQIFRPIVPIDYPPRQGGDKTGYAEGTQVKCTRKIFTPFVVVQHIDEKGLAETWFAHGSSLSKRGNEMPSELCYKPEGFTWKGGMAEKYQYILRVRVLE